MQAARAACFFMRGSSRSPSARGKGSLRELRRMSANDPKRTLLRPAPAKPGKSIQAGRNYSLLPSFVCQALELTAVEAAHERYHLHHRTYCGDYGHSVVPRIALATNRR